jgi:hypothetical protein
MNAYHFAWVIQLILPVMIIKLFIALNANNHAQNVKEKQIIVQVVQMDIIQFMAITKYLV